ncbi:MAG: hypothetical protein HN341_15480 [Verrucomicrobia bacterium]|nr:hypothetical protein [Verrucomicrobiota bacterium]
MKTFAWWLSVACMVAIAGCKTADVTHAECAARVQTVGGAALSRAGQLTVRDHMRANTDGSYPVAIPRDRWHEPIRKLRPIRVYHDRLNLVIVLSETEHTETGVYVRNPIASYSDMDAIWSAERKALYNPDEEDVLKMLDRIESYNKRK